jgi:hypothetical protein
VKKGVNSLSTPLKCFEYTERKVAPVIPWKGARYIPGDFSMGK